MTLVFIAGMAVGMFLFRGIVQCSEEAYPSTACQMCRYAKKRRERGASEDR